MANVCLNCNKNFATWTLTEDCDNCENGQVESTRDYGWDKYGMMTCPECYGTELIVTKHQDFCSHECMDEYFENND